MTWCSRAHREVLWTKEDKIYWQRREEHLGRVRTAGYGVGVRQYFGLAPRSSSATPTTNDQLVC